MKKIIFATVALVALPHRLSRGVMAVALAAMVATATTAAATIRRWASRSV
jgi:hypothetical protein